MHTEIEVKFCQVDIDDLRTRLKSTHATLEQPMRLMRRRYFTWLIGIEMLMRVFATKATKSQ